MIILDTYCKAGGAGRGYYDAGFDVVGVDIDPQPHYPFEFIQADAVEYIKANGHKYDAYHASPPCQKYSCSTAPHIKNGNTYPDLIQPTRDVLISTNKPFVIENVSNAPIRPDIVLYGYMFGLKVIRKRMFELGNWFCLQPGIPIKSGSVREGDYCSVFGKGAYRKSRGDKEPKFKQGSVQKTWAYAMGIDWYTTCEELAEAIPPAYTHWIGIELINYLNNYERNNRKNKGQ